MHPLYMSASGDIHETYRPAARGWRRIVPWFWPKSYRYATHTAESLEELPVWKWYGCFCHRGQVVWNEARMNPMVRCLRYDLGPHFFDGCWRGGPWCCKTDDVDAWVPDYARVGAMGFLLSCKRACDEALYILYSTNTIWIEEEPILPGLLRQRATPGAPMFLSPSIALITSLKVRSHFVFSRSCHRIPSEREKENEEGYIEFAEQLDLLPRAFPNLERGIYFPVPLHDFAEVERIFLGPLLRATAMLPRLRELVVSLSGVMFFGVVNRLDTSRWQSFVGQRVGDMRVWYPLTEQPGDAGPDGGGFWMVYNGERGDQLFEGPVDRFPFEPRGVLP